MTRWTGYYNFWKGYRFKNLFKGFNTLLLPQKNKLEQAKILAKKNSGKAYRQAEKLLKEAQQALQELSAMFSRMALVNILIHGCITFAKKLLITETTLIVLVITIMALLGGLEGGKDGALNGLAELATDPWFQKKALVFSTLLLAPFIALSWTLMKLNRG